MGGGGGGASLRNFNVIILTTVQFHLQILGSGVHLSGQFGPVSPNHYFTLPLNPLTNFPSDKKIWSSS